MQIQELKKILEEKLGPMALAGGLAYLLGVAAILFGLHIAGFAVSTSSVIAIFIPFYLVESLLVFYWLNQKSGADSRQGRVAEWMKLATGATVFAAALLLWCILCIFLLGPLSKKRGWAGESNGFADKSAQG